MQAFLQVGKTIRQRRKTLLAGIPIAGRQVEQRLRQAVAMQAGADLFRRMFIGKQEFDGRKAGPGGGVEAVRNGTSLNIIERLAAKRGIERPLLSLLLRLAG